MSAMRACPGNDETSYGFQLQPVYAVPFEDYVNTISYDWNANSDNRWTIPLGLGASKTFALSGGHGVELLLGAYKNVERPEGAAEWQLKWAINWLMP